LTGSITGADGNPARVTVAAQEVDGDGYYTASTGADGRFSLPVPAGKWRALEQHFEMVGLDGEYVRLRMIKSEEESDWMKIGAALSDAGIAALVNETRIGMTERELANLVERSWVGHGGTTMIHYIGCTAMASPGTFQSLTPRAT